jgi:YD repeat-containing protein
MRSVAGFALIGPVRTCRHEHAEWDQELGAWQALRGVTIVTFRPDGQVSEGESHNHDGSVSRWAHTYDHQGRLVEVQSWTNDGPRSRVLHAYDSAGRPTINTHVAPDGTRREGETYSYDSAGRKTLTFFLPDLRILGREGSVAVGIGFGDDDADEGLFYDTNHQLIHRMARSRDQDGRVLREIVELSGETPFGNFQGDLGKVPVEDRAKVAALAAQLFADGTFVTVDYTYDERGRTLERMMRMGGLSEERTTFRYDDRDDPTDEVSEHHSRSADIDDGGMVHTKEDTPRRQHTRYEYQYDDGGNWIERITWSRIDPQAGFQRSGITRRTITYYG